jgi:hypothetical protein
MNPEISFNPVKTRRYAATRRWDKEERRWDKHGREVDRVLDSVEKYNKK